MGRERELGGSEGESFRRDLPAPYQTTWNANNLDLWHAAYSIWPRMPKVYKMPCDKDLQ